MLVGLKGVYVAGNVLADAGAGMTPVDSALAKRMGDEYTGRRPSPILTSRHMMRR